MALNDQLDGKPEVTLDYYVMEEPWTLDKKHYESKAIGDCMTVAKELFANVSGDGSSCR